MYLKSNVERLKSRKRELGWSNMTLSQKSGIPVGTLNKIFSGTTRFPREKTIDALVRALGLEYYPQEPEAGAMLLREQGAYHAVREEHRATLNTYYSLPDGMQAELIDGKFYYTPAPALQHHEILTALAVAVCRYFQTSEEPCRVFAGGCEVRLDADEYTMLRPDLFVVRGRGQMTNASFCNGAPEFVAEIISPENPELEYGLKRYKYQKAGVKEYWIVDFVKMRVVVYAFVRDMVPSIYGFENQVRSWLYPDLEIDFSRIREAMI